MVQGVCVCIDATLSVILGVILSAIPDVTLDAILKTIARHGAG